MEAERGGGNLVFVDLARPTRGGRHGTGLSQGLKILLEDQGALWWVLGEGPVSPSWKRT